MGQTERGSFTLKVACQLDAFHPDLATTAPTPPFDKIIEPDSEPARNGSKEPFTRQWEAQSERGQLLMRTIIKSPGGPTEQPVT